MQVLLSAGLLYLIIIAATLFFKPSLMFNDDGTWKEFGLGRDERFYTWMPFWLFAILLAITCYLVIFLIVDTIAETDNVVVNNFVPETIRSNIRNKSSRLAKAVNTIMENAPPAADSVESVRELLPGYYVLNAEGSANGIPRYIYLGPKPADA
jgi:hypothetical protein